MTTAKAGPHKCKTPGCDEILSDKRVYCCACMKERTRRSMRKYNARRAKPPVDSQAYVDEHLRTPRWFSGRILTVIKDPYPYPLSPGLVLDRHATATMVAAGCFTNGMQLRDHSSGQIFTVIGAQE